MAILTKMISYPVEIPAVFASMEPYIPSQKRMVSGFKKDMKNPVMRDCLSRVLFPVFESISILCSDSKFSIPVYKRTKQPKDQRIVFNQMELINWPIPKYTINIYIMSVAMAPRLKNHA